MKKGLLLSFLTLAGFSNAQLVSDSVTMGAGYANNIWYSLQNDEQGTAQAANNWDLGFATTINPSNPLAASIIFNNKIGSVYAVPGTDGTDLATADTTGMTSWTPLYNSEATWSEGALNTASAGGTDYGWGNYDAVNHTGIVANRVFAIKYSNGSVKLFTVSLSFMSSEYTVDYSNADHSGIGTATVGITAYATKNFVYLTLGGTVIDREPVSTSWDLVFTQYAANNGAPYPYNMVTGILHNVGVQVAEVHPVDDPVTDMTYTSVTYSEDINTIGYDWKTYAGTYTIEDSLVYFVKDADGDYWRLIMTGFSGSSLGKTLFKKEKVATLNVAEKNQLIMGIFPNPAADIVTVMVDSKSNATVKVMNMTGQVVFENAAGSGTLEVMTLSTATFTNGVYLFEVSNGTATTTQRLVVQH
ncbi:T9SS type A sorting domain-containing protein [Fluviicola chungangensis]|uniref:T9SS type A sorting domain-containing protein n=1 Tax=Fluviicola chungangensis TaxID=2597671 RepID=A0A556MRT6_9FLAO|nr:T9SS type A sorting domain-containing protein [Fluviicola chungangensis]TSJ42498.1 T9SS type A sorting domain-containing protein [Fluviicola chungangensis]